MNDTTTIIILLIIWIVFAFIFLPLMMTYKTFPVWFRGLMAALWPLTVAIGLPVALIIECVVTAIDIYHD